MRTPSLEKFSRIALSHSRRSRCEAYRLLIKHAWERGAGLEGIRQALLKEAKIDIPRSSLKNFVEVRVREGVFGEKGSMSSDTGTSSLSVSQPERAPRKARTPSTEPAIVIETIDSPVESVKSASSRFPWPPEPVDIPELSLIAARNHFPLKPNGEIDIDNCPPPINAEPGSEKHRLFLLAVSLQHAFRKHGERGSHAFASIVEKNAEKLIKKARVS